MSWTRLLLSERVVRRVDTRTFGPRQPQGPQDVGFPAPCDLAFFDDGLCLLLALVKKPICRPAPWSPLLRHCCHCGHSFRLVVASRHRRSRFARNGSTNPNIASAKHASIKFHKAAGELVRFFTRDPLFAAQLITIWRERERNAALKTHSARVSPCSQETGVQHRKFSQGDGDRIACSKG